jgi:predicted cupin superfamily sugar epimerase
MVTGAGRSAELIGALGLRPHPEGGYFAEVFRSPVKVFPEDGRPARPALTSIYFLLPAGAVSRWGEYTLVACTVGPGFEFQDFVLAGDLPELAARFRGLGGDVAELL